MTYRTQASGIGTLVAFLDVQPESNGDNTTAAVGSCGQPGCCTLQYTVPTPTPLLRRPSAFHQGRGGGGLFPRPMRGKTPQLSYGCTSEACTSAEQGDANAMLPQQLSLNKPKHMQTTYSQKCVLFSYAPRLRQCCSTCRNSICSNIESRSDHKHKYPGSVPSRRRDHLC